MELSSIKRYAEHNYDLLYSDNPNKVSKGVDISFDYEGQAISNPWIDPSARFELTTDKAVETYGLGYVLAGTDRWVLTNKSTGKSVTLAGWAEYDARTFDVYFQKDNKIISSVPSKTDWKKLGL